MGSFTPRRVTTSLSHNIDPLLERAFMFLEDGDFQRADAFLEQVLNQAPQNAYAYLGKLMVEFRIQRKEDLSSCPKTFKQSNNYKRILLFGSRDLKQEVEGYLLSATKQIEERTENNRRNIQFYTTIIVVFAVVVLIGVGINHISYYFRYYNEYQEAERLYQEGNYIQAYEIFDRLAMVDFSDSKYRTRQIEQEIRKMSTFTVGNLTLNRPFEWRNVNVTVTGNTITLSGSSIPSVNEFLSWLRAPTGKSFYATDVFRTLTSYSSFKVFDDTNNPPWYIYKPGSGEDFRTAYLQPNGYLAAEFSNHARFTQKKTTIVGQYYDYSTQANPVTFTIIVVIK